MYIYVECTHNQISYLWKSMLFLFSLFLIWFYFTFTKVCLSLLAGCLTLVLDSSCATSELWYLQLILILMSSTFKKITNKYVFNITNHLPHSLRWETPARGHFFGGNSIFDSFVEKKSGSGSSWQSSVRAHFFQRRLSFLEFPCN